MAKNPYSRSQVRKHYYLDEYVVIAPKRENRPFTVRKSSGQDAVSVKQKNLPIENEKSLFEIKDRNGDWLVKVVKNKYPALSTASRQAYGHQEIVLETSHEGTPFYDLPIKQIELVLNAYQNRALELRRDPKVNYVSIFKNHGIEAGASMAHTHSQIIATQIIPPGIENEEKVFTKLKQQFGASPLGAALEWEREQQLRIIQANWYVTALAPYASQRPLEVWLIPNRYFSSITDATANEIHDFAVLLKGITGAIGSKNLSFNFFLHEKIDSRANHFMIQITPRPNIWAGFELSTKGSLVINPVSPERAASWYRSYLDRHAG